MTVAVYPPEQMRDIQPLLEVLGTLFPVRFTAREEGATRADGLLCLAENDALVAQALQAGVSVLVLPHHNPGDATTTRKARFTGNPSVQPVLRGLEFDLQTNLEFPAVKVGANDVAIAEIDGRTVWTEQRQGTATLRQVTTGLPRLGAHEPIFPQLLRGGWIRWLPLFHFLREITAAIDWQPEGLRACFIFDDPNLHWPSWGFIDYEKMADHARASRYHAAMATVPLDMWFTHAKAAGLFRRHKDVLSLLVHGVEHTHAELQRSRPAPQRLRSLTWSLKKVSALERRHALSVSRVMAPPHHACSFEAADLMLQSGYDAACVSWTALMRWNPHTQWRPAFGLEQAEFMGQGFPIIPRFNFADHDKGRAVLAAFFHQPIVLIGHHYDLANGLDVLADWARFVNSLGNVTWCSMDQIVRHNYLVRKDAEALGVKLFSRHVQIIVPKKTTAIRVERPWMKAGQVEEIEIRSNQRATSRRVSSGPVSELIPVTPGECLEVIARPAAPASADATAGFPSFWPLARRLLCEARDRSLPLMRSRGSSECSAAGAP